MGRAVRRAARAVRPPTRAAPRPARVRSPRRARAAPSRPDRRRPAHARRSRSDRARCRGRAAARAPSRAPARRGQRLAVEARRAGDTRDVQPARRKLRIVAADEAARVGINELESRQPDDATVVGVPVALLEADVDDGHLAATAAPARARRCVRNSSSAYAPAGCSRKLLTMAPTGPESSGGCGSGVP